MRAWIAVGLFAACGHSGAVERAQTDVLRNPNEVTAWVALGDAYRRDKQGEQAAQAYANALQLDPGNEQLQRRAGSGARPANVRALEAQVLAEPRNDELWGDLGDAYAEMGDRVTALRHYQYALSLDPDDGEWQRKTVEFMPTGDIDAMMDVLRDSRDDEAIGDLADQLRAEGREDEACELYLRAMMIDPGDSEWQTATSSCPNTGSAMDEARQMALDSGDDERIGDVGDFYMQQGDQQTACELYGRAAQIDPDDSEWRQNLMGCSPEGLQRMRDEAIASGDDERIGDVGDVYREQGDRDAACELYSMALSIDPDDSEWQGNMADCGMGFQDYEGRPPPMSFEGGTIGGGVMPAGPSSDSLVGLGRVAMANGDRATALQHFEAALLESPGDRDARVGVMAITDKTLVIVLEELTNQRGEDDELWGDLGDAYLESGRKQDALRAFQRAEELDPDDFEWSSKLDMLDPSRMGSP